MALRGQQLDREVKQPGTAHQGLRLHTESAINPSLGEEGWQGTFAVITHSARVVCMSYREDWLLWPVLGDEVGCAPSDCEYHNQGCMQLRGCTHCCCCKGLGLQDNSNKAQQAC